MNAALALLLSLFCVPALAQSSPDAVLAAVEKRVESEMRASASPFMHAMRARDETVESSRLKINLWIRYNFEKAFDFKSKGDSEGALFHYLMARHTLRDATSPTANDAEGNPAILDGPLEHHELRVHGWRDKVDQDMQSMFDTNRVPPGDLLKMYGIDSASGPIDRPGQLPRPDLRGATPQRSGSSSR